MVVLVAGPGDPSRELASSIAETVGGRLIIPVWKRFPDGEHYVRIPEQLNSDRVYVVQTLGPPQNDSLVQAMLLADAALGSGASSVGLIAPYTAYSRQDKRFLPGEPISIKVVLRALSSAGYDELITVEIHKPNTLDWFQGRALNLSPYEYMAGKLDFEGDILVLSPDLGAIERARRLASALDADYDYLVKHRDRVTGEVTMEPKEIPARGKTIILVDDIISTGGTIARATRLLFRQGARKVYALVAHALLVGNALEKLEGSGILRIYAANTVARRKSAILEYIDIGPLIGRSLSV